MRYFLVHLQKTAGTSLRDRLRNHFTESEIYPNRDDGRDKGHSVISVSHLLQQWERRGQEIRLLSGHFPLSAIDLIDAEFRTISVLRPPVERTLSYLRHQRALDPEKRDAPLEEIYDDPFLFRGLIRNHMTRTFSLGSDELGPGDGVLTDIEDTRERLDRAKLGVEGLDAYGLQPRFEELCDALRTGFGLDVGEPLRSNATRSAPVPEGLVERIRDDNALDLELYEFAEELYETRGPLRTERPG